MMQQLTCSCRLAYAGNKNYRFPHCSIDFYTAKTLEAASASFYFAHELSAFVRGGWNVRAQASERLAQVFVGTSSN
jgi:hypothetical protein